ncbi:AIPR family protein [Sodalis glossinidius]|uniref:AIPR family protein n=1 Tax=Sodalis glossinidius TaxID=63612 RepID=UPI001412F768|nr:AIPR family protein [Sodalis glossinidius]
MPNRNIPSSLRSSDVIHRNIEDYFKANDFYYDRKKKFYKNSGKPASKIISIAYLAQSMMAIFLLKPDTARARPSTLLNSDVEYKKIFSRDINIDIYLKVTLIIKTTEAFLKSNSEKFTLDTKTITNIKFYVAMVTAIKLLGTKEKIIDNLSSISRINIKDDILLESLDIVLEEFNLLGSDDKTAKGPSLTLAILKSV